MLSDSIVFELGAFEQQAAFLQSNKLALVTSKYQLSKPVAYVFLSDDELLEMNRSLLNHDYYTDIITLDYSDDDDYEYNEVYISVDRVAENAQAYNVPFEQELVRVCIHGILHLAGFDDKTQEQKEKMSSLEDENLALYRST